MRILPLFLLSLPALAGTIDYPNTVDGVGYGWQWTVDTNTYGEVSVQFSAPISSYQFVVDFPAAATGDSVFVALQDRATVTWADIPAGQWQSPVREATVTGAAPDVTHMEITVGVTQIPASAGAVFPLNFHFTNLVDPPVGAAEAPEPSTLWLICGGLVLTIGTNKIGHTKRFRQWRRM